MAVYPYAWRRRRSALIPVSALLISGLAGVGGATASAAPLAAPARVVVPSSVPAAQAGRATRGAAAVTALAAARRGHERVEITADRTPYSQTFANPAGTFTSVVSAVPQWVKRGASWVAADASLVRAPGGTWAPRAAEASLAFSGGGGRVLATIGSGSQQLSVSWPSALPTPVVAGARATYRNVLPGVDLLLTAQATGGFDETLIIRDKAAAADPGLRDLSLGVSVSKGLRQRAGQDGSVVVETAGGTPVFSSPAPVAWDSAPGRGTRVAAVGADYSARSVRLAVPSSLLSGPAASFPVYVDPSYSESPWWSGYGEDQSAYPTSQELNNTYDGNVSVGYDGGGVDRGEYAFGLPNAADSAAVHILSATMTGTVVATFTAASTSHTINAYDVSQYTWASSWDDPPSHLAGPSAQTFTTTSTTPNQNVSWNVASWLQTAYNGGAFQMSVELDNSDETSSTPFVKFGPWPTLTYTYSQPAPTVPTGSGPAPSATLLGFPISDKASLQVNAGSGDALVTTSDLSIPQRGSALTLGTSYNSLLTGSSVAQGSNGDGWRQSEGVDVRLYLGSDGSATLLGEDGTAGTFTAPVSGSTYGSPAVFAASLTSAPSSACSGSSYQLTWHQSGAVMCFNADGLLTSEADRNGNKTAFSYNGNAQETGITYTPAGGSSPVETVAATYTGNYLTGLSESGGSAGTKTITYTVGSAGDLTSVEQADGTTITFGYDSSHDLTSIKNGAGKTTTLAYNSAHQVTSVTQPYGGGNAVTRLSYVSSTETEIATPDTNQSQAVSAVPHATYTLSSQDLVTKAVDPAGDTRQATYTPFNDVATSTNGLSGGTTTNTYGANGGESLTASQSPTGATTALAYGNSNSGTDPTAEFQPSAQTDAQGNETLYTYDGAGNALTSENALAATAKVSYNTDGAPATSTDPDGGVTTYSYNASHQLTKVTPPTSGSLEPATVTYDGFGRVATVTDGAGNTVTYTYDLADRITKEAFTGGSHTVTVTYAYDGAGNLKTQVDPSGTTSYTHDGRNLVLTKNATAGGGTLTYAYDADGNMASATDAAGTTRYSYNDLDQLTSLTDTLGKLWEFAYNAAGERTTEWLNTNPAESSWEAKMVTSFDAAGRVTRIQAYNDDTLSDVVSDTSYCYSKYVAGSSCPTSSSSTDTSMVQYSVNNQTGTVSQDSYDYGNRLTKATNDNGTTYSYGYDGDGDVTSGAFTGSLTYNTSNQITNTGYSYDGAGNLTADTSDGTLSYNDAGQLISASDAEGSGNGGGSESFTYAGANQDEPLSDGSATAITYGLAGQVGQPWVDSYTTGGGTNYVIRDQQGDPLGFTRGTSSYLFVTDNSGSVTDIIASSGALAAGYGYTPYGALVAKNPDSGGSIDNENLIGYTGSLTDQNTAGSTGYTHDGDRWYRSANASFTSEDINSYLASPSNGNRYAYAGDNPLNFTDPTGQDWASDVVKGAAAGAVTGCIAAIETGCAAGAVTGSIVGAIGAAITDLL